MPEVPKLRVVADVEGCRGCPMQKLYPTNTFVPVRWGDSLRVVCAEAPGELEAEQGVPLVGGSGRVAQSLYAKAGIPWDGLTLINVVNCRPLDNKFPDSQEARSYISEEDARKAIHQCVHNHVKPVLEARNWERVDLLGEKALRYIAGIEGGITAWRGYKVDVDTDKL